MNVSELLKKLERVKAPPDFEQKLITQLELRRGKKQRFRILQISLAGVFSAALVFFIILNVFILPRKSSIEFADLEKSISIPAERAETLERKETIRIIEAVDYNGEVQRASQEPMTIYLLEQVSETTTTKITY